MLFKLWVLLKYLGFNLMIELCLNFLILLGDLQLMSYKAACASHLYGQEMEYVVRVCSYVNEHEKEHDRTQTLLFLRTHMQNSVGFFSNFVRK